MVASVEPKNNIYLEKIFGLAGKTVIITGGSGLLGREFCKGVALAGGHPIVVDLDQKICDEIACDLTASTGMKSLGVEADVTDTASVNRMVRAVIDEFGTVDVLVNNAQYKSPGFFARFEEFPVEDWDAVMAVNMRGMFLCSQVAGKQMLIQEDGVIINLASTYGVVAPDHRIYPGTGLGCPAVYSASKGGVIMFTKYLATYWADKNIRVNAITPHGIYNQHEDLFVQNFSSRSPIGRMCNKEEVVGALLYLASDASSYVTGHNLIVDGGWTTW